MSSSFKRRYDFPRAKPGAETHVFRCKTEGMRLDQYLVTRFTGYSRSFLAGLIREGRVLVGGAQAKPGRRLLVEDEITVMLPEARASLPEEMDIPIIHEDENIFVVNKPPGIVVHPARGHLQGTLYHGLLWRFRDEKAANPDFRIGPIHRLDQDTSGLLVYAKDEKTQQRLAMALERRNVKKRYLAIVHGELDFEQTVVEGALGPHEAGNQRVAVDGLEPRPARTGVTRLSAAAGYSLVECDLLTGRCHQIRVHLQALGHPIAGDLLYGGRRQTDSGEPIIDRQALHAWRLSFEHPVSCEPVEFTAPPPADLAGLAERAGLEDPGVKLVVAAFGKLRSRELAAVADDYAKRLKRYCPAEVVELRDERGEDPASRRKEAERLEAALRPGDQLVLLDERGRGLSSPELAALFAERARSGGSGRLVFAVGGPFGVDESVRRRANLVLSLSRMTLPHELARVVLLEQLYRAWTILRGEKYHHG